MRKIIADMMLVMKNVYPYFAKDMDIKDVAKAWDIVLANYSTEEIQYGFSEAIRHCTMPPSPADVVRHIERGREMCGPNVESMWQKLVDALDETRNFVYKLAFNMIESNGKTQGQNAFEEIQKIYEKLPRELQLYVANTKGLIQLSDYDLEYEKARFLKAYKTLCSRAEYEKNPPKPLGTKERKMIEE